MDRDTRRSNVVLKKKNATSSRCSKEYKCVCTSLVVLRGAFQARLQPWRGLADKKSPSCRASFYTSDGVLLHSLWVPHFLDDVRRSLLGRVKKNVIGCAVFPTAIFAA